jgi:hypothetical protein
MVKGQFGSADAQPAGVLCCISGGLRLRNEGWAAFATVFDTPRVPVDEAFYGLAKQRHNLEN